MSIRAILVGMSGGAASSGASEVACRLALRFGAHVEGLHVKVDPREVLALSDGGMGTPISADFFERLQADADSDSAEAKAAFQSAISTHCIPWKVSPAGATPGETSASAAWREEKGNGPALLARRARFFDLAVLGRSDRIGQQPHSDAEEKTILLSGRPVLLAAAEAPTDIGGSIVIGWNGSPEVVRAMAAALSFLATARNVLLVTIGDKHQGSAASALEYLSWRKIDAKHQHVPALAGVAAGEHLLTSARDAGADLLVMGAYSHAPWREYLFGGVTHDVTRLSSLSLLMAH
jgi:nucleotide-binding universal stress UspA family protein